MTLPPGRLAGAEPPLPLGLVLTSDPSHACDTQGLGFQSSRRSQALKGGDCLKLALASGVLGGGSFRNEQHPLSGPLWFSPSLFTA